MKFLMHISFPPEQFNEYVKDGSIGEKMGRIMSFIKPEAAYFTTVHGNRGGILVVNMKDASEIPSLAEPWFLLFNADIEFQPCMSPENLAKAGLEKMGKKWAS